MITYFNNVLVRVFVCCYIVAVDFTRDSTHAGKSVSLPLSFRLLLVSKTPTTKQHLMGYTLKSRHEKVETRRRKIRERGCQQCNFSGKQPRNNSSLQGQGADNIDSTGDDFLDEDSQVLQTVNESTLLLTRIISWEKNQKMLDNADCTRRNFINISSRKIK